jgi:hypothetical protein
MTGSLNKTLLVTTSYAIHIRIYWQQNSGMETLAKNILKK